MGCQIVSILDEKFQKSSIICTTVQSLRMLRHGKKYLAKNIHQANFQLYYSQHIITVDCSDKNGLTIAMNHLLSQRQNLQLPQKGIKKENV